MQLAQRSAPTRRTTPPGLLKQIEEAAQDRQEQRAQEATGSSPIAPDATSSGIIDTFIPARQLEQQQILPQDQAQYTQSEPDIVVAAWLQDKVVLHRTGNEYLLRVDPVLAAGVTVATLVFLILTAIVMSKVNQLRSRKRFPKIKRIEL